MAYNTAAIAIETDFEFVKNKIEHNTARFMLDFNNIAGPLREEVKVLAEFMEKTAKEFAAAQTEEHTGNLIKGIQANVHNNVIELKSSAYKLPKYGNKAFGGEDLKDTYSWWMRGYKARRDDEGKYIRDSKGNIIYDTYRYKSSTQKVKHRYHITKDEVVEGKNNVFGFGKIIPQDYYNPKASYRGATGLHALGSYDINRYKKTRNIQYYGGHVEFGHRLVSKKGQTIGFVRARPHLRPALRVASAASIGEFQNVLKQMLSGVGASFDGYRTPSLTFGMRNLQGLNTKSLAHNFALNLGGNKYSVRHKGGMWNNVLKNDMGWGHTKRPVDFYKYGFNRRMITKDLLEPLKKTVDSNTGKVITKRANTGRITENDAIYGSKVRPWGSSFRTAPKGYRYYLRDVNGQYKWKLDKDTWQYTSSHHLKSKRQQTTTSQKAKTTKESKIKGSSGKTKSTSKQGSSGKQGTSNKGDTNKGPKKAQSSSTKGSEKAAKRKKKIQSTDFDNMSPEELEAYRMKMLGRTGANTLKNMRGDD